MGFRLLQSYPRQFFFHIVQSSVKGKWRQTEIASALFASNGILFNHESPRIGSNFVTSKIIKTSVEIAAGKRSELVLGNLDAQRDWGHSRDYVRAMHLILQHNRPDDFVVTTGETHSVRDLVEIVFRKLDLDFEKHVKQDKRYMRPEELPYLRGDASKARSILGWEPQVSFEQLVDEMIQHWVSVIKP